MAITTGTPGPHREGPTAGPVPGAVGRQSGPQARFEADVRDWAHHRIWTASGVPGRGGCGPTAGLSRNLVGGEVGGDGSTGPDLGRETTACRTASDTGNAQQMQPFVRLSLIGRGIREIFSINYIHEDRTPSDQLIAIAADSCDVLRNMFTVFRPFAL